MRKILCYFMICLAILCSGMFVGCDKENSDINNNGEQIETQKEKCFVNGIEYDVMIATAQAVDSKYNSTINSYQTSYDIEIRLLLTNHNDVEFSSNTKIFKFTASNNNASWKGVEESYFGEIKIWRDMENASEFTIPAKSSTTIDLSFNSGIITEKDGIFVELNSDGSVRSYEKYNAYSSYTKPSFYDSCKKFMEATDFNIYIGNELITNIDFIVSNL